MDIHYMLANSYHKLSGAKAEFFQRWLGALFVASPAIVFNVINVERGQWSSSIVWG